MSEQWTPPPDLDAEVLSLCRAMNLFPGITTVESCCGHGRDPYRIWFVTDSLDALPLLLYWFDGCHTGHYGWSTIVNTDCAASPVIFRVEGPCGDYAAADAIARHLAEQAAELADDDVSEEFRQQASGLMDRSDGLLRRLADGEDTPQ
jgi:hypothetical protein